MVDNDLFNLTVSNVGAFDEPLADLQSSATTLPDLKSQVQQWLQLVDHDNSTERSRYIEESSTVFVVWFCLWDVWYYSYGNLDVTQAAIAKTIDSLFEQLNLISEKWTHDLKILMLNTVDLTRLPIWHMKRTGPQGSDERADHQKRAIALIKQWNNMLESRASLWNKGAMYIFDAYSWLSNQILVQQLYEQQVADANGLGLERPTWEIIDRGCLGSNEGQHRVAREEDGLKCLESRTYLFW